MKDREENKQGKRISALDIFAALLLILCVAGLVIRLTVGREGVLPEGAPESDDYAVSFEIAGQRSSAGTGLSAGDVFYTEDDAVFGTVTDQISVTPARIYTENEEGRLTLGYSSSEGDSGLVDIRGTMTVVGYPVDYGFLAGGKTYVAPNHTLILHTDKMTVSVRITDVTKIG